MENNQSYMQCFDTNVENDNILQSLFRDYKLKKGTTLCLLTWYQL